MTDDATELDTAIAGFLAAEAALREITAGAQQLSEATAVAGEAGRSLAQAEKSMADSASAISSLASALKDNAQELQRTALRLRSLDPEDLSKQLAALQKRLNLVLVVAIIAAAMATFAAL